MLIEHLQYFIKASECRSMSAAAKELNVTQQTISMAIKNFEQELGCRVFYRSKAGICLTADGKHLLQIAQNIADQWESMKSYANTEAPISSARLA